MNTPVTAAHQGVTLSVEVPDTLEPLDIDKIQAGIQAATQEVTGHLVRLKFAHDIRLLRAMLYTLGSNITLVEAHKDIEEDHLAEEQANGLLHGYLAGQGWRPYEPVDGRFSVPEEGTSIFGIQFPKKLGQTYGGDLIVDLWDGRTLKAKAKDAYTFEWVDVTTKRVYIPSVHDQWWLVAKYPNPRDVGYDPHGDEQRKAFRDLTVPAVPADLDAMLDQIRKD